MKVEETKFSGVLLITPEIHYDERGCFYESFQSARYAALGIQDQFVQDNISRSVYGTLRGLHYQLPQAQGKLVCVLEGSVVDVVVDLRVNSPTFGEHLKVELSAANHIQLFVPVGFAHGFCVISTAATFLYKCTGYYNVETECGIAWNDPELAIDWPTKSPLLSAKDTLYPCLKEVNATCLYRL